MRTTLLQNRLPTSSTCTLRQQETSSPLAFFLRIAHTVLFAAASPRFYHSAFEPRTAQCRNRQISSPGCLATNSRQLVQHLPVSWSDCTLASSSQDPSSTLYRDSNMSDLAAPRTPRPESSMRQSGLRPSTSPVRAKDGSDKDAQLGYPARAGAITPPPSTQIPKPLAKSTQAKFASRREHSLASPPATLKTAPPITSNGLYGEVPSLESVEKMNEEELRRLVSELLPALGEARVTAAHSKLQHNLLAIET